MKLKSTVFLIVGLSLVISFITECYPLTLTNPSNRDVIFRVRYIGETQWPLIGTCTLCPDEKTVKQGDTWHFDTGLKIIKKIEVFDAKTREIISEGSASSLKIPSILREESPAEVRQREKIEQKVKRQQEEVARQTELEKRDRQNWEAIMKIDSRNTNY